MADSAGWIEILEPLGETEDLNRYHLAPRVKDLNGKVLGMMSNHGENADLLLEKIKTLLVKRFKFADVLIGTEAELAEKCQVFVTGIGH